MKQYLNLLQEILDNGTQQANRTGIDAISIPGAMVKFDLAEGFPAVTTKKLFFGAVVGELLGFIRGYDNAADFRALGCKIWDQNANDPGLPHAPNRWLTNPNRKGEDDLGRIYGKQWTDWQYLVPCYDENNDLVANSHESINQLQQAIETIEKDPTNRRIIVSAWRPDEFDQMALPPCHVLFQFLVNVEKKELNLCWYQRSVDSPIGLPFNIASYALLLELVAKFTGYRARHLTGFLADTHIYVNQIEQVQQQLLRTPFDLPKLSISTPPAKTAYETLLATRPEDISLVGYECHPPIKMEMAV